MCTYLINHSFIFISNLQDKQLVRRERAAQETLTQISHLPGPQVKGQLKVAHEPHPFLKEKLIKDVRQGVPGR